MGRKGGIVEGVECGGWARQEARRQGNAVRLLLGRHRRNGMTWLRKGKKERKMETPFVERSARSIAWNVADIQWKRDTKETGSVTPREPGTAPAGGGEPSPAA